MSAAREAILEATATLLERQGYGATGLNQIVATSGAPKGSLYYYFPDGKDGLVAQVIERVGHEIAARIRSHLASSPDPAEAVRSFIRTMAGYVQDSACRGGGPLTTVALETTANERLNALCGQVYADWQAAFAEKLVAGGFAPPRAAQLATMIIASIEGAIILTRTSRNASSLELVADELALLIAGSRRS